MKLPKLTEGGPNMKLAVSCVLMLALVVAVLAAAPPAAKTPGDEIFYPPVRLEADGKAIDHGAAWGHCGPTLADVDGDGKLDLVVGDFSGHFTWYKNIGTTTSPQYAAGKPIIADGKPAEVYVY